VKQAFVIGGREGYLRHFAQPHQVAVSTALDHQSGKVLRRVVHAADAGAEIAPVGLDAPGGQLDILGAQGILNIVDGKLPGRQLAAVEIDAHGVFALAAHNHQSHSVHHRQPVDNHPAGVIGQLQFIEVIAGEVEPHDGIGIGIGLAHPRCVNRLGQLRHDAANGLLHIVDRRLHIALDLEFNGDPGITVAADRIDIADGLDTAELILQHAGHLGVDDLRRRAAVGGVNPDDRRVHIGVLAQRQLGEGHDAKHHQQGAGDNRQGGALDGQVGEEHGQDAPLSAAICTTVPARIFWVPSTTTCSPASRPATISTSPGRRLPSVTVRRSTLLSAWSA